MKTIIILGSKGMAGSMLLQYFTSIQLPCRGLSRPSFDVSTDWRQQLACLNENYIVINCIGIIPQKIQNIVENVQMYTKINSEFPHELAEFCQVKGAFLIHLSTNCVFENGPSDEHKRPDASDVYGFTKAKGEPQNALVIRTSIIGPEPSGSNVSLLEWFLHSTSPVRGFTNHTWNGVTTLELAKTLAILLKNPLEPKILHLFSQTPISKHDLLCYIQSVYKTSLDIIPFVTATDANTTLQSIYPPLVTKTIQEQIRELYTFSASILPA
jgi:dTDP-4-dehydrorhamnose reductase